MLVKELIEQLRGLPEDMEVGYQWEENISNQWHNMFGDISKISICPVALSGRIVDDSDRFWPRKAVLS